MKRKLRCTLLCFLSLLLFFSAATSLGAVTSPILADRGQAAEGASMTLDVPLDIPLSDITNANINLRLHPAFVETATLLTGDSLEGVLAVANQTDDRMKIALASGKPFSLTNGALTLRLTLKATPLPEDELCRILQVKVDEETVYRAEDCLLISGVRNGAYYREEVTPRFNEGSATLNGAPFSSGTAVSPEGSYTLRVTDLRGTERTLTFVIDRTPPVITVLPYATGPTVAPLTVYATVEGGTLEQSSHTFHDNGSFTFVARDEAGNVAQKTVTLTNLLQFAWGDANGDGDVNAKDVLLLRQYIANYDYAQGVSGVEVSPGGDANGDGEVNAKDLLLMRQYIANYDYAQGSSSVILGPGA